MLWELCDDDPQALIGYLKLAVCVMLGFLSKHMYFLEKQQQQNIKQ